MKEIIVIGSLNMDMIIEAPGIPQVGETIFGKDFMIQPGGKGANQAVAVAKLGGRVLMIGCVGDDVFGKSLVSNLQSNGVDVSNIKINQNCSSGIAMIIIQNGDNSIIVAPGANGKLDAIMIDAYQDIIKKSFMVLLQLEIPLNTVKRSIELVKKNNVKVLLNPALAVKLADELLSKIDIITPNETESEAITGIFIRNDEDARAAVKYFRDKGIRQVVITLGSKGVIYNNNDKIIYKPAYQVDVIDTTAAGDTFSGALAVALSKKMDIDSAIDFACIASAITVTRKGAQVSIPTLNEVQRF